jgi:cell division protein FtsB
MSSRIFAPDGDYSMLAGTRRLVAPLAFAAYAAFAVYCLASLIAGPAGLLAYAGLEERRGEMAANLGSLGALNESLRAERESLRSDADRAAREARSLGYLKPGETALLLPGRNYSAATLEAGAVLPFDPPSAMPDESLKGIALGVGLGVLALALAPRRSGAAARRAK